MVPTPTSFAVFTLALLGHTVYQECDSRVEWGTTRAWFCQTVGFSSEVQRGTSSDGESELPATEAEVSAPSLSAGSMPDRKLTDGSTTPSPNASNTGTPGRVSEETPTPPTWWCWLDGLWNGPSPRADPPVPRAGNPSTNVPRQAAPHIFPFIRAFSRR